MKTVEEESQSPPKQLTDEEALDLQIKTLQSSPKIILNSIIQNETDPMSAELPSNLKINNGIYLYLQNIHNKHYCSEINTILNSMNSKISYINDKIKDQQQTKKSIDHEINWVTQERIDNFNEKENLDKELELLQLNTKQNSLLNSTISQRIDRSMMNFNVKGNPFINNEVSQLELEKKNKKLNDLKKKYENMFDNITKNKKDYPNIKIKNNMLQGENMVLNEKLKQKNIIFEQLSKENEEVQKVVIKRDYTGLTNNKKDKEDKKNDKKNDKNKGKNQQKQNIKVSKIGSFLNGFFKKK